MAKSVESPIEHKETGRHTLVCAGCGKPGVSICPVCAKTRGRILTARANPLKERNPDLYARWDEMSRLPLNGNEDVWDEFIVEIGAGRFYEHLPLVVEIVQEGKWRTDVMEPVPWIRETVARRVARLQGREDYDQNARRRPSYPKYDRRNGALIQYEARPFAEFEVTAGDGDVLSAEDVIEGKIARRGLQTRGCDDGFVVMLADRESLSLLRRLTLTERRESAASHEALDALMHNRDAFDEALSKAVADTKPIAERLSLDCDEAEVVAVTSLLWAVGPRTYLNFLDETNRKRVRNAWDRLERKLKKPELSKLFRIAL